MKSYFFLTVYFITTVLCYSQNTITWGKEKINLIDEGNLKQGKWVFFLSNHEIAMTCEYKNDTLSGNRIFYANNQPLIIRENATLKVIKVSNKSKIIYAENFTFLKNNKKIKGYYDKSGNVFLDSKADSLYKKDIQNLYITEIPAIYYFGLEDMNAYLAGLSSTIKKPENKSSDGTPPEPIPLKVVLIQIEVDRNGKISNPKIINGKSEYEGEIMAAFIQMKRWQPAFKTWNAAPSAFTIAFNF